MIRTWARMGWRNLLASRRRAAFTLAAAGLGYTAINLFAGFVVYVFAVMEDGFVHAYANGHLHIIPPGAVGQDAYQPSETLFTADELAQVLDVVQRDERVLVVTPQIMLSGLASNGRHSIVFSGMGRVPEDVAYMRRRARTRGGRQTPFDGFPLTTGEPAGIGLGVGMVGKLETHPGGALILISTTVDGQMNAVDAVMRHAADAPSDYLQDLLVDMPLSLAHDLLATDGADRLVVLLHDARHITAARRDIDRRLAEAGLAAEVRTWYERLPSYDRLQKTFGMIFAFVAVIILSMVSLSVFNTLSITVLERTREIGALRALGLKRRGVLVIFGVESATLALIGACAGLVLSSIIALAIRGADWSWHPPVIARPVPIEIFLTFRHIAGSFFALTLLSVAAALLPARRAAWRCIVDALGHV